MIWFQIYLQKKIKLNYKGTCGHGKNCEGGIKINAVLKTLIETPGMFSANTGVRIKNQPLLQAPLRSGVICLQRVQSLGVVRKVKHYKNVPWPPRCSKARDQPREAFWKRKHGNWIQDHWYALGRMAWTWHSRQRISTASLEHLKVHFAFSLLYVCEPPLPWRVVSGGGSLEGSQKWELTCQPRGQGPADTGSPSGPSVSWSDSRSPGCSGLWVWAVSFLRCWPPEVDPTSAFHHAPPKSSTSAFSVSPRPYF